MSIPKNSLFFIIFLFLCVMTTKAQDKKHADEKFRPLKTAKLLSKHILTKTGRCSDGSDRARDGKPRFSGPMEARIVSFKNYQYVSYYENDGSIIVARKKRGAGSSWQKSILQGYKIKSEDRHNKIAMAISKGDGVIHLSFDHHNSPQFHYAHSKLHVATNPAAVVWDNSVFSLQPNLGLKTASGLVTYPTFYTLQASGNLIIYWRTGGAVGGEMNLARYSSADHKWHFIGKISSQEGTYNNQKGTRGPYTGGFYEDAKGTLHVAWVFREREAQRDVKVAGNMGEHGLYYVQSTDGGLSWKNNKGKTVANVKSNLIMGIDNLGPAPVKVPMTLDPSHVGLTSITDPKTGDFITLLSHYKPKTKSKYLYLYTRTPEGKWFATKTNLSHQGKLKLYHDKLFVFSASGISYANRASGFTNWKRIAFPLFFENGRTNWDVSHLNQGLITMVIQYNPKKLGNPTPVEVFNFKIIK